jgi:glutathione peroxidase-family protein
MANSAWALKLGETIPAAARETKMLNVDGKELTLAGVSGKHDTLVIFSCNHCPYARAWEERIVALGNTYQDRGVGVMVVNSNDPQRYPDDGYEEMQRRARLRGYRFPYVVDSTSDVAVAFGATRTPEVYLFNKDGKLYYQGAVDNDTDGKLKPQERQNYLQAALDALVAGKQGASAGVMQVTKSIGCGIKFRSKAK